MVFSREKASLHRSKITRYRIKCARELKGIILDCGGGLGAYLPYFECKPVVLDIDMQVLAELTYPLKVLAEAEKLPFQDDSFDGVWACAVVQYLHLEAFVREAIRVTKEGGSIFILVPNAKSPWDFLKKIFGFKGWHDQKGIVRQYTPGDLRCYGKITGEIQFLPFEALFRNFPVFGHTLMLKIKVNKQGRLKQ